MRTSKKILVLIALVCFSFPVLAQQHLAKTLLWRITGNGLQKPSYLFGTMHLTDKRLFNFTDSVYKAIETSDGLAIELNPDEMIAYFINKTFDELQKGKKIKDILDNNDYKKYSSSLEKKFGKPADEITAHDVVKEKNKWMTQYLEKGEMPTFVDGYLYSTAKKQGKWIGGIEDVADQADVMDDMVDKTDITYMLADNEDASTGKAPASNDNSIERMINIYTSQDIEGLEQITNTGTSAQQKDLVLTKRNIKMARRIDSLSALRTMFFAVGAAHLPGDSGVIRLLRARGFTVEPVMSNKKIASADYKFKEVEIPWVDVNDDHGLYKVSMPGNPVPLKLYGVIDMKFLFDLSNFTGFYTMAIVGAKQLTDDDSVYKAFTDRMFKGQKVSAGKKIESNGVKGREFAAKLDEMTVRLQIFLNEKVVYLVMAYALKKENISAGNADKFFSTFSINKNYAPPVAKAQVFADSVIGISFKTPVALEVNKTLTVKGQNGWNMTTFAGVDMAAGSYVMLSVKDVVAGMHIPNDSTLYNEFKRLLEKQYNNLQFADTTVQGKLILKAEGDNKKQNLHLKAINTVMGNRAVTLLILGETANLATPQVSEMFASFKFLPAPYVPWQQYAAPSGAFSMWGPAPVQSHVFDNALEYVSFDTTTAATYSVTTDTLNKYQWAESDSSFWQTKLHAFVGIGDSILNEAPVQDNGLAGKEIFLKKAGSTDTYRRVRMLANGNIIYKLFLSGGRQLVLNDNAEKFFTNFKVLTPVKESFISRPKTADILNDLQSSDSATRFGANSVLHDAPFTSKDLPLLHDALFRKYLPMYDSSQETFINERIANSIQHIGNNTTVDFIKNKYSSFTGDNEKFKPVALSLLAGIHTKYSYTALVSLLQQAMPKDGFAYTFEGNIKDSLALTASIYPALLPLIKDSAFALIMANVTVPLLDSGLITTETLKPYENDFITLAARALPAIKKDKTDYIEYDFYKLVELLGKFNTPGAYEILKDYLQVKKVTLLNVVVKALLTCGQQVPAATFKTLAADAGARLALYNNLKELNKSTLFPPEYLTQQYFAQSDVYASAEDDDEDGDITAVTFLMKKNAMYKDTSYTFYLYKVVFGTGKDASTYLGVAGGYKTGSTAFEPVQYLTALFWKEAFNAKKVSEQFNAFMVQVNKAEGEEGGGDDN